jgi:glycosyltransferase involved in cell wall biosynthesis
MKQRRVLVVTNMYPTGDDPARGAFVLAQVRGLEEAGVETQVVVLDGRRQKSVYWTGRRRVAEASRRLQPDFVYAFYGLTGWVCLAQPAPIVLSLAGDDILGTPKRAGRGITIKSRLGIVLSQWAAFRAAAVCVQSEQMRGRLWTRALRERAHVIPYGVDATRFSPGDRVAARHRLGVADGRKLVIFPNTPTEPRKRLDLARAAVAVARASVPDTELQVVNGVSHETMVDYYRAADCTLLTSDWEGSPNVVKESLFCGTPVVTTDVGDVQRWIPLTRSSAIVDRTPESIGAALVRVLRDPRREDPTPIVNGCSVSAVTNAVLSLADAATAEQR